MQGLPYGVSSLVPCIFSLCRLCFSAASKKSLREHRANRVIHDWVIQCCLPKGVEKMNNEQILVKFLNCGFLDLKVLEDTKFDVMEIISEMERPTLNDIIYSIFQKGIDLLLNALKEKQRDFDCPDEIKYLSGEDIDFDINFIASRIYFSDNGDIWNKFFGSEIEDVEEKMGFHFG